MGEILSLKSLWPSLKKIHYKLFDLESEHIWSPASQPATGVHIVHPMYKNDLCIQCYDINKCERSLRKVGQGRVTPKSIGFLWYQGWMCGPSKGALPNVKSITAYVPNYVYFYLVVEKIEHNYWATKLPQTLYVYTFFSIKSARYKIIIKQYALNIGYIHMRLRIEILRARDLHCISMWK